jgi:hypothetical protein
MEPSLGSIEKVFGREIATKYIEDEISSKAFSP